MNNTIRSKYTIYIVYAGMCDVPVFCAMEKSIPNMLSSCFLQNLHEFRDIFTFCRFFLFRLFFYRAYRRLWKTSIHPHVGASEKDRDSVYTTYIHDTHYICVGECFMLSIKLIDRYFMR